MEARNYYGHRHRNRNKQTAAAVVTLWVTSCRWTLWMTFSSFTACKLSRTPRHHKTCLLLSLCPGKRTWQTKQCHQRTRFPLTAYSRKVQTRCGPLAPLGRIHLPRARTISWLCTIRPRQTIQVVSVAAHLPHNHKATHRCQAKLSILILIVTIATLAVIPSNSNNSPCTCRCRVVTRATNRVVATNWAVATNRQRRRRRRRRLREGRVRFPVGTCLQRRRGRRPRTMVRKATRTWEGGRRPRWI
mmetsp:Transcript_14850/g.37740  ORF Transcript_14850/g.37740 Transcript_14850/m.37740 type:complete len:245 (-) Transcript_14850:1081-1815(-)